MSSNNPVGSTAMVDLFYNAGNLDKALNSDQDHWRDRFGQERITYAYMERLSNTQALVNQSRESLRRSYAEVGLNLVPGSFEQGGTLESETDVLLEEKSGKVYGWEGTFPKVVSKNTNPVGFILIDKTLLQNLSLVDGERFIGACPDIQRLRELVPSKPGQKVTVIGYYLDTPLSGGGTFIYDHLDTTSEDDGVIIIVGPGGCRWKRRNPNKLGYLCALDAGARPDNIANLNAGTGLSTGTDNTPAQIRADKAAERLGCRVKWPAGQYRFVNSLERRVIHEGCYTYTSPKQTIFIFDNPVPTTWLLQMPGRDDGRQQDINGIWFYSVQQRTHRLLDGGFYRGTISNIRVSRFDVGLDVSGVYLWVSKSYFDNNNKAVYPRALHGTPSLASTMFSFEECVFISNTDVGFLSETRNYGIDSAAKELLNVQFIRCGFEQNQRGLVATNRIWYLGLLHCWFEGNKVIGFQSDNQYTDVFDICTRFDDPALPIFPKNRYFNWGPGGAIFNCTRKTNFKNIENVVENKNSYLSIKQDGTILNNSGLPVTISISVDSVLTITFATEMTVPLISVTPVIRNQYLTSSVSFDNTNGVSAVGDNNRINIIRVKCFDPVTPATLIKPLWWNISISWPSILNT